MKELLNDNRNTKEPYHEEDKFSVSVFIALKC